MYRVLSRINLKLGLCDGDWIDAQGIGKLDQVEQDIGNLSAYCFKLLLRQRATLRLRKPLEVLQQFGGFDDQCRCQVLRRVKLLPVPFSRKLVQLFSK